MSPLRERPGRVSARSGRPAGASPSGAEAGCLALFALPFAAVGLVMGFLIFRSVTTWMEMRSWQEVPASILESELRSSTDSDSTTHSVRARYRYTFAGREYLGDRVGIHGGSDNIGSFHQRAASELEGYRRSGEPFRCFVDPDSPDQAVLYRELRPGMVAFYGLFVVTFGGTGFGLILFALVGGGRTRDRKRRKASRPREPWKWRPEWAEGVIRSGSRRSMFTAWAFAAFWNLISAPLLFVLPGEVVDEGNHAALLGLIFPFLGIGLLGWAIRETLRWRRFGRTVFEMAAVPGVVGGALRGVIYVPRRLRETDGGFEIRLSCVRRRRRGSGKSRSTNETVLWQDSRILDRPLETAEPGETVLPVLFAIPFNARESVFENPDDQIVWRLEARAEIPGVDLDETFEVPVYRTEKSSKDFVLDEGRLGEYLRPSRLEDLLERREARVEELPGGGRRYDFPPHASRAQKLVVGTLLAGSSFTLGLMLRSGAGCGALVAVGIFQALLTATGASQWTARYRIEVTGDRLTLVGGSFGLGKARTFEASEIGSLEVDGGIRSGRRIRHGLQLRTRDGKRVVAVPDLGSRRLAETLKTDIEGRLPAARG